MFLRNTHFTFLKRLLGKVPLPLDLDVQGSWDVWHQDVDQLADPENNVLKDDDKGELDGEDLPMNRCKKSMIISESTIVTFGLKFLTSFNKYL